MKKFYLSFILLVICYLSFGQILINESFDSIAFPPPGWINKQVDGTGVKAVWDRDTIDTDPDCIPHSGKGMARYFAYNLSAGNSSILVSPSFDLSVLGANTARISFWMFRDNSYPTKQDSLDIYINDTTILAGAVHLVKINRYKGLSPVETNTGWYKYNFDIPSSFHGTDNYIILKASSVFGYNILIDDFTVEVSGPNDAGISALNTPGVSVNSGSHTISVTIKNYGTSPLYTVSTGWTVDGVVCTSFLYMNNSGLASGSVDSSVCIGSYNFITGGKHIIKVWTQYPNSNNDINHINDTLVKDIWVQAYGDLPFAENFNGVWIDKRNSNDVPSLYWNNTPEYGNNSWRRNDEGLTAGWISLDSGNYAPLDNDSSSYSARFHSYDVYSGNTGKFDLFLNFSPQGYKALKFWYFNEDGNDSLSVMLSVDGGGSFNLIQTVAQSPVWTNHQINLGTSTSSTSVIRFLAKSDFGYTDIGLDSVEVVIDNSLHTDLTESNTFINIYPNPANGTTNIYIKNIPDAELSLFSLSGQKVFSQRMKEECQLQQIDLTNLSKGTYIIQVKNERNNIIRKLVVQ
ncbi:MAG TPA: T9SS type A sorting domain-containing protein [Bacteroidales bacterium]|nr:T9SS type A sorting domain-containing protein [Bacteroidales bacterium]